MKQVTFDGKVKRQLDLPDSFQVKETVQSSDAKLIIMYAMDNSVLIIHSEMYVCFHIRDLIIQANYTSSLSN